MNIFPKQQQQMTTIAIIIIWNFQKKKKNKWKKTPRKKKILLSSNDAKVLKIFFLYGSIIWRYPSIHPSIDWIIIVLFSPLLSFFLNISKWWLDFFFLVHMFVFCSRLFKDCSFVIQIKSNQLLINYRSIQQQQQYNHLNKMNIIIIL